ncbi:hypothetical protein OCL06_15930 [Alteromonas sp. ASW11-19]|uniref:Transcriptional regulator n=1 Tax=Alteromonas salexigens TaxID=2982530 RepID=A0ABT2VRZ9_9ALTE|nr:hypothetical protein [Alteromonas salexigens]MCU7556081.1 hypothetical protein [Alteromonas salexigens]
MDTKARNKQLYQEARQATGCSQNDWARLFTLTPGKGAKHGQKGQSNVALKESGTKGVNQAECLASELLRYFQAQGYDVKNTEFDEDGRITSIPKR